MPKRSKKLVLLYGICNIVPFVLVDKEEIRKKMQYEVSMTTWAKYEVSMCNLVDRRAAHIC